MNATEAMAEIERKLDVEAATKRERPRLTTAGIEYPKPAQPKAFAPQTLPAILAEMQAVNDSGLIRINDRLARIEAFLGIEP